MQNNEPREVLREDPKVSITWGSIKSGKRKFKDLIDSGEISLEFGKTKDTMSDIDYFV